MAGNRKWENIFHIELEHWPSSDVQRAFMSLTPYMHASGANNTYKRSKEAKLCYRAFDTSSMLAGFTQVTPNDLFTKIFCENTRSIIYKN